MALILAVVNALSAAPALPNINTNNILNVTNYGAVGDAVTTNTVAIQNAINAATLGGTTNGLSGGTVRFPAGIYLSGPLTLKSAVNIQLDAGAVLRMLPFGQYPLTYATNAGVVTWTAQNFIYASSLHDISVTGSGAIDGQGTNWWPYASNTAFGRPIMLRLESCSRLLIQNVTLSNSPEFHISISGSSANNSTVMGVTIRAPSSGDPVAPGHNTDACDVAGTSILVQDCNISVGDDDFTCGGNTANVLITNCVYGNGHGVSVGSYTSGGVSNITVVNCSFTGTDLGIRIKSDRDRGGLVQAISYLNLTMTNVAQPILIYTEYTNTTSAYRAVNSITPAVASSYPSAPVTSTTPIYSNILLSNITATAQSGKSAGLIWGLPEMSVSNLTMMKVKITADLPLAIHDAQGVILQDCQIISPATRTNIWFYNSQIIVTNSAQGTNSLLLDGVTANDNENELRFYNAIASTINPSGIALNSPVTVGGSLFTIRNSFSLSPTNVLNYVLGANQSEIFVQNNLTLGGIVNISAGGGFTNGTYNLISAGGSVSGPLPMLGTTPPGTTCSLDSSVAGLLRLQVGTPLPGAPGNPSATGQISAVLISWPPATGALTYNVKRSTIPGGPYVTLSTGIFGTNFTDTFVTNGQTYYYVVSATNNTGEGPNSAEASAVPYGSSITFVNATAFNDVFSTSSIGSTGTNPPDNSSTAYQVVSSKTWTSGTPSISPGHMDFGIGATTSGSIEAQALFTTNPIRLATVGDSISLLVTFTNKSGLLTQSGALGFGLYNSGQYYPVPGGLNSTATTSTVANAVGYCQNWQGYVGQVSFAGSASRIMTRSPQTAGTANNNQDLVTSGSGSASYANPVAANVGATSTSASPTLSVNSPYTELLAITLTTSNTLAITNTLYSGTDTNGILISQFGAVASGTTFLTNSFDAIAAGWRATANTSATLIDVNRIAVNTALTVATAAPSLTPVTLVTQAASGGLLLSWPTNHTGWSLQIQTNLAGAGLGTNWITIPGSNNTNQYFLPMVSTNGSVFLRLSYP